MNVDDFIQEKLKNKKNVIRLKNYQVEILKILDSGLTVRDVYKFLSGSYPELEKMSERHLYEFVRKIKAPKNPEVGQAKPEPKKTAEPIEPPKENEPVNLQEKLKENLANVRGENSAETIAKNTEAQIQPQRRSKSILSTTENKPLDWNEFRKSRGMPNPIDDEWRNKPTEEE